MVTLAELKLLQQDYPSYGKKVDWTYTCSESAKPQKPKKPRVRQVKIAEVKAMILKKRRSQ